jgi:hypothetical protein
MLFHYSKTIIIIAIRKINHQKNKKVVGNKPELTKFNETVKIQNLTKRDHGFRSKFINKYTN